ncbi:hypothetical protein MPLDJ20_150540 [Mesorhizobium plurifarium]|uniref:Uncharacterized protein n=1 Tax=Mesorhizobium plurifarium TaxID=69974 RepID=A0A090GJC5_MESPL|nr:hypothetical protein MPLDJ20_150540 [Mesorhizobium plurifarium]
MTRFGLTQKALVNHRAPRGLNPGESGNRSTELRRAGESAAHRLPQNRLARRFVARHAGEDGGEDGIRTHEKLLTSTPLAGERLRPLGHLSVAPLDKEKRGHNQQAGAIIAEKSFDRPLRQRGPYRHDIGSWAANRDLRSLFEPSLGDFIQTPSHIGKRTRSRLSKYLWLRCLRRKRKQ